MAQVVLRMYLNSAPRNIKLLSHLPVAHTSAAQFVYGVAADHARLLIAERKKPEDLGSGTGPVDRL